MSFILSRLNFIRNLSLSLRTLKDKLVENLPCVIAPLYLLTDLQVSELFLVREGR